MIQTGVNNVLNTIQDDDNIKHQMRCLIREGLSKVPKSRLYITSIIPTDSGGLYGMRRLLQLNKDLKEVARTEGAIYIDMKQYITENNKSLNKELYQSVYGEHIHLNYDGNKVLAYSIAEQITRKEEPTPSNSVFRLERNRYKRNRVFVNSALKQRK